MNCLSDIRDLIKSCLLPELKQDLDSIPIEEDHFKDVHKCLEIHLPLLYDCIEQEPKNFVWAGETDEVIKQEIQAYLILLLCEISAPNSIFKLNKTELVFNAERILQKLNSVSKEVDELIFKYYEEKLDKDKWKRQLGAVNGFVNYLEFRFRTVSDLGQTMSPRLIKFCLAVALNIRLCYDAHYKNLSTSIFMIILQHGDRDDIISMNIHSVIYDAVFKDISIMDSTHFVFQQWSCLIKCLDFYENFDSFEWNYLDDIMEVLLRNISLSSDSAISICLLKFVNKLIAYYTINYKSFEDFFNKELLFENMNEYRLLANANTSYTCYRWAKRILHMFVLESFKLFQSEQIAKQMLQEIHKIFILTILPIQLSIVEPHLINFLDKFIPVLMETIKVHKYQEDIMAIICSLLETFYFHLQNSKQLAQVQVFEQNIYALLKSVIFEKYSSIFSDKN